MKPTKADVLAALDRLDVNLQDFVFLVDSFTTGMDQSEKLNDQGLRSLTELMKDCAKSQKEIIYIKYRLED